jgi:hypothetical protein
MKTDDVRDSKNFFHSSPFNCFSLRRGPAWTTARMHLHSKRAADFPNFACDPAVPNQAQALAG